MLHDSDVNMGNEILYFVPNIIGYARLICFGVSLIFFDSPLQFLVLYNISIILDGFDGYFARRLNQTSAFGAWFDVVIDLVSRGGLWCFLYKWGYFVIIVEWLTFVSTHRRGADWKIPDEDFPIICKMVMAKGFKTPLGVVALIGINVLPVWLYCYHMDVLQSFPSILPFTPLVTTILILGRLLALRVEVFFIASHLKLLLDEDGKL